MNAEVINQWVEALESGKYQQGRGALRKQGVDGETFCCLGVLCDLRDPQRWAFGRLDGVATFADPRAGYQRCRTGVPPDDVMEWAGLTNGFADKLAQSNDGGVEFPEIAAMIREWASTQGVRDE